MKVLISRRSTGPLHSSNYAHEWIPYCEALGLDYDVVDLLAVDKAIDLVRGYDILLWHFDNYDYAEMLEARSILYSAAHIGVATFPSFYEAWHFDDKIAQMYLLDAVRAPMPRSYVYYDQASYSEAVQAGAIPVPIVAKLRTGSGSNNVRMLRSQDELLAYGKQMFGRGYDPSPKILLKTVSNIRTTYSWKTFVTKFKRIPEFLRTLGRAKEFHNERGYVYLQEFVPNDGFDMRVLVVGDKVSSCYRPVRKGDFRASGAGVFLYDQSLMTPELIDSAFAIADALQSQCVGYDVVFDNQTGAFYFVEISLGMNQKSIEGAGGYFDRQGTWHNEPLNTPKEILKNLLARRGEKVQE